MVNHHQVVWRDPKSICASQLYIPCPFMILLQPSWIPSFIPSKTWLQCHPTRPNQNPTSSTPSSPSSPVYILHKSMKSIHSSFYTELYTATWVEFRILPNLSAWLECSRHRSEGSALVSVNMVVSFHQRYKWMNYLISRWIPSISYGLIISPTPNVLKFWVLLSGNSRIRNQPCIRFVDE